jgi:hypothetical protein
VFAPSNGHVGRRGNLDEGEPHGLPGSYLNGVHELHPLPYAEAGHGYPESGCATAVSSPTNELWTCVGVLERTCEWISPAGSRAAPAPQSRRPLTTSGTWPNSTLRTSSKRVSLSMLSPEQPSARQAAES